MDTINVDTGEMGAGTKELSGSEHPLITKNTIFSRLFVGEWREWGHAFGAIAPLYIAVHVASFVITCLSVLFLQKDFAWGSASLRTLERYWLRWDANHFTFITVNGYDTPMRTAFFPLYPLLARVVMFVTHNALVATMIVSNLALLVVFMVLYRLTQEEIDAEHAQRAVLYLALFPTAFFLQAAYNESLFLCFTLLCFYELRHGNWWLAGLYGGLASLTRSAGVLLVLPFCYEYLVQRDFQWRAIRWNVLAVALIPLGTALFAAYCAIRFHDPLAFSHAQSDWNRALHGPWHGLIISVKSIVTSAGLLSFQSLRNFTDLIPDLLIMVLLLLSFVGPWRFTYRRWSYGIYALALLILFLIFPNGGVGFYPLESTSRFMLEIFPAFFILAKLGRYRMVHLNYVFVSGAVLFFLLTQFLTGHWVL